jgi:hypothetical protein
MVDRIVPLLHAGNHARIQSITPESFWHGRTVHLGIKTLRASEPVHSGLA